MFSTLRDLFMNAVVNQGRYKTHHEAVIIACYGNPRNNPYRLMAFQKWYRSIKHLNHRIIECTVGDAVPQLRNIPGVIQLRTGSLLWHKETLLNKIVADLPSHLKYVFWVDADVMFTNQNWLVDGVKALQTAKIIQPFEYCVHLERNQSTPDFDVEIAKQNASNEHLRHKRLWRSFCANYVYHKPAADSLNYDVHGHVGFAWGARREVLDACPLYDGALIGGADHIIAHAAAGQLQHPCITKSFTDNLEEIGVWERKFYSVVQGDIGYVPGDLYHIWHGEIIRRQYLKRIQDSTKHLKGLERDENGLHVKEGKNAYFKKYFRHREADAICFDDDFYDFFDDVAFVEDMGYALTDLLNVFGQSTYDDSDIQYDVPNPADFEQPAEEVPLEEVPLEEVPLEEVEVPDMSWQVVEPVESIDGAVLETSVMFPRPSLASELDDGSEAGVPVADLLSGCDAEAWDESCAALPDDDDTPADALEPENAYDSCDNEQAAFDNGDTFTPDTSDTSNFS